METGLVNSVRSSLRPVQREACRQTLAQKKYIYILYYIYIYYIFINLSINENMTMESKNQEFEFDCPDMNSPAAGATNFPGGTFLSWQAET